MLWTQGRRLRIDNRNRKPVCEQAYLAWRGFSSYLPPAVVLDDPGREREGDDGPDVGGARDDGHRQGPPAAGGGGGDRWGVEVIDGDGGVSRRSSRCFTTNSAGLLPRVSVSHPPRRHELPDHAVHGGERDAFPGPEQDACGDGVT